MMLTVSIAALSFPDDKTTESSGPRETLCENHSLLSAASLLLIALGLASACSATATQLLRGPYLQLKTTTNVVIRWRTDLPADSRVQFGTNLVALTQSAQISGTRTNHELNVT